jgi:formamidopyrimidine-DNA glycosylase
LSRGHASISVRSKRAVLGVKRDVKSVLTDQQIIAGIGNIYSDEILFQARIDSAARMDELTLNQIKQLFLTMREVLKTAITHGAGSELFTERMPKGTLLPERKKGGHCRRCRSPLNVFKVGDPTAYCCPQCQNC